MKVLVYGAGVLGSYLAHVLVYAGNDVTLLAHGNRYNELVQSDIEANRKSLIRME